MTTEWSGDPMAAISIAWVHSDVSQNVSLEDGSAYTEVASDSAKL